MTIQTKAYIAFGATLFAVIAGIALWSNYKISSLEADVALAKQAAQAMESEATQKEFEAAGYRQKIAYLERQVGETQILARKQDEKLEKHNSDSRRIRVDVDRARRTRAAPTDAGKLCEKLAELGHPCEQ